MFPNICVVIWLFLAVAAGVWSDFLNSYGLFYPLFALLCSPPLIAIVGLLSGRVKAAPCRSQEAQSRGV